MRAARFRTAFLASLVAAAAAAAAAAQETAQLRAVAMQTLFDVRANPARWAGADCASSFPLQRQDGSVVSFFLFGDTLVCDVDGNPPRRDSSDFSMPHSTAATVRIPADGSPPNASDVSYAVAANASGSVVSLFRPEPVERPGDVYWWTVQGISDVPKGNVVPAVMILAARVQATGQGPFGFQVVGTSLLSVADASAARPAQWAVDHAVLPSSSACLAWTTALFRDPRAPEHVLIMGQNACGPLNATRPAVLARMPAGRMGDAAAAMGGSWQFLVRSADGDAQWAQPPSHLPVPASVWLEHRLAALFPQAPPETTVAWVDAVSLFVSPLVVGFGPEICVRTARRPEGPWEQQGRRVYTVPPPLGGAPGVFAYAPKLHPELPCRDGAGAEGLTLTFATNTGNGSALFQPTRLALDTYVPQFVCLPVAALPPPAATPGP